MRKIMGESPKFTTNLTLCYFLHTLLHTQAFCSVTPTGFTDLLLKWKYNIVFHFQICSIIFPYQGILSK